MKDPRSAEPGSGLDFLQELVDENVVISGDIPQVGADIWAIHGVIPADGEVIIAEFDTYEQAKGVLDQIAEEPGF
jgi:hypothetical protein